MILLSIQLKHLVLTEENDDFWCLSPLNKLKEDFFILNSSIAIVRKTHNVMPSLHINKAVWDRIDRTDRIRQLASKEEI